MFAFAKVCKILLKFFCIPFALYNNEDKLNLYRAKIVKIFQSVQHNVYLKARNMCNKIEKCYEI